ncbi:hypothetical protein TRVL_08737 [Trypanosoma vivax]|nr:hypothetical protein TRVL_08737 [Trypanosoma vivax]
MQTQVHPTSFCGTAMANAVVVANIRSCAQQGFGSFKSRHPFCCLRAVSGELVATVTEQNIIRKGKASSRHSEYACESFMAGFAIEAPCHFHTLVAEWAARSTDGGNASTNATSFEHAEVPTPHWRDLAPHLPSIRHPVLLS